MSIGSVRAPSPLVVEEVAGDHDPLDLRRALVDARHLRVPHQALDRVVAHVPVAAEDLHRLGGDPHRHLAREQLGPARPRPQRQGRRDIVYDGRRERR